MELPTNGFSTNIINNKLVILGGIINDRKTDFSNLILEYDNDSQELNVSKDEDKIGCRIYHSSVTYENKLIVLGGYINDFGLFEDDVYHIYDLSLGWKTIPIKPISDNNLEDSDSQSESTITEIEFNLSSRVGHRSILFEQQLIIFGGYTKNGIYSNQLFNLNLNNNQYYLVNNLDYIPHGRCFHSFILNGNFIYLFGGYNGKHYFNDLWQYDTVNKRWEVICNDYSHAPKSRFQHQCFIKDNKVFILGGKDEHNNILNDLWCYDNNKWYCISNQLLSNPFGIYDFHMFEIQNEYILIGGIMDSINDLPKFTICFLNDKNNINIINNSQHKNNNVNNLQLNHQYKPSYQFSDQQTYSPIQGIHFHTIDIINEDNEEQEQEQEQEQKQEQEEVAIIIKHQDELEEEFKLNTTNFISYNKITDSEILDSRSFGSHIKSNNKLDNNQLLEQLSKEIEKDYKDLELDYNITLKNLIYLKTRFTLLVKNSNIDNQIQTLDFRIEELEKQVMHLKAVNCHLEQNNKYFKGLINNINKNKDKVKDKNKNWSQIITMLDNNHKLINELKNKLNGTDNVDSFKKVKKQQQDIINLIKSDNTNEYESIIHHLKAISFNQAENIKKLKMRNDIILSNLSNITNHQFSHNGFDEDFIGLHLLNNPILKFLLDNEIFNAFHLSYLLDKSNNIKKKVKEDSLPTLNSLKLIQQFKNNIVLN